MKKAWIVTDLGFGDSGKGTIVDYLTLKKEASLVVKFNGGPQAAHNVHTPDGRHFTFSQFGSGSFNGADTYLSKHVAVDPLAMLMEGRALSKLVNGDVFARMNINDSCEIITPYHREYNRLLEKSRGNGKHGSCGIGHGISVEMSLDIYAPVLHYADLKFEVLTTNILFQIYEYLNSKAKGHGFRLTKLNDFIIGEKLRYIIDKVNPVDNEKLFLSWYENVVFEGAQGALLDETHGFHPYCTWSTTTRKNADKIIANYNDCEYVHNVGVTRTFMTRHGAGPFVSEGHSIFHQNLIDDDDNVWGNWQGKLRVGDFDLPMLKYALSFSKVDSIAVTHYDKIQKDFVYVDDYGNFPNLYGTNAMYGAKPERSIYDGNIVSLIEEKTDRRVSILSSGKTHLDKKMIREI